MYNELHLKHLLSGNIVYKHKETATEIPQYLLLLFLFLWGEQTKYNPNFFLRTKRIWLRKQVKEFYVIKYFVHKIVENKKLIFVLIKS